MSVMIEIHAESGFLHVGATGKFSLAEAKRTFWEMLEAVARYKVDKVLLYGREIAGEPELMERFYYGKFAANAVSGFADRGAIPTAQFTYVIEEPVLDAHRFGETVTVNRGMIFKALDNVNDALGCLREGLCAEPLIYLINGGNSLNYPSYVS